MTILWEEGVENSAALQGQSTPRWIVYLLLVKLIIKQTEEETLRHGLLYSESGAGFILQEGFVCVCVFAFINFLFFPFSFILS